MCARFASRAGSASLEQVSVLEQLGALGATSSTSAGGGTSAAPVDPRRVLDVPEESLEASAMQGVADLLSIQGVVAMHHSEAAVLRTRAHAAASMPPPPPRERRPATTGRASGSCSADAASGTASLDIVGETPPLAETPTSVPTQPAEDVPAQLPAAAINEGSVQTAPAGSENALQP